MSIALEPPDSPVRRLRFALTASPALSRLVLCLPALIALVIWRLSLRHVTVANLGNYGLPPALPIAWYLALSVSVVGAVTAITARRTTGLMMVVYIIVVAIILYGTVPVLSAQPHYAWVYKHIGVVRYLEVQGKAKPSIDIYNRWPGFFALAAAFSRVAGRSNPVTYVSWAELFFLLLDAVLVMAAVKAIARDLRIAAGAALFFILTNWVGQTYYSPQAFTFALGLALIVVMARQLRVDGARRSKRVTLWIERVGRVPQLSVQTDTTAKWPRWAAITVVLSLDAVIVASHQLTPYMLLGGIALLVLAGVVRPWWVLMWMAIMTFAYLGANFNFVQHNYGVFNSIDPFNNVQRVTAYNQAPSAGKTFNTHAELLAAATLWLIGVCASICLLRRGLLVRALPLLLLAVSPFAIAFGQNYGGETPLRIVLFSSPWWSALISWAVATVSRRDLRWALMASLMAVFTALFVPAYFGQEELNIVSAGEVQASAWFYDHARRQSVLVLSGPGFPVNYGASYFEFRGGEGEAYPSLLSGPTFRKRQLGAADIPSIISRIKENAQYGYITFSKDQTAYAEAFRLTPPRALEHLESAVARSPDFRLWYRNKDAQIYELVETHVVRPQSATNLQNSSLLNLQLVQQVAPVGGGYLFSWQSRHARIAKKSRLVRRTTSLDRRHRVHAPDEAFGGTRVSDRQREHRTAHREAPASLRGA